MTPPETYRRHIPEDELEGRRLGRHVHHDPRSRLYPAETVSRVKSVVHAAVGLPLDQGQIGSCTANALCGALNSQPDYKGGTVLIEADALKLYEAETQLEGEPYPPNDPGGSGLMVCRAAKHMGLLRYYRHAFGLDNALRALAIRPAIFGFNWYDTMDSPNAEGVVRVGGSIRGGHEVVADEIDTVRSLVGFWNSWGSSFGLGGRFYLSFDDLGRLLSEQGDCTVPYPA